MLILPHSSLFQMCFSNQSLREMWGVWLNTGTLFFFRLKAEFPKEINQMQLFENWTYYAKLMYPHRGREQSTWN